MPDLISETTLQTIISNFAVEITEYEIIDLEKYQGWSSTHLYLLVSSEGEFILKAKTSEQVAGYDNEVKVCNALLLNGIQTRQPILTKVGDIFYKDYGYFWCLMTYIHGASSHIDEYNEITAKSLAEHIDQYVTASITESDLKALELSTITPPNDNEKTLARILVEKDFLVSIGIMKENSIEEISTCLKEGFEKYLQELKPQAIIHNDINPRNILIDHTSKKVVAFIDWDHVKFDSPLKDVSDVVAIFYDFLSFEKATRYKKLFLDSFTTPWFTQIDKKALEFAFFYYYSVAKWRAIFFYLDLLRTYDNRYGERDRFIFEIKQSYDKWLNITTSVSKVL